MIRKMIVSLLGAAMMVVACPLASYAQTNDFTVLKCNLVEASPRYNNILATGATATKTRVFGSLDTYNDMSLSIKAVAYRNGNSIDSYSASGYGDSLILDKGASLRSGDIVKFTFKAGNETVYDTLTVK